MGYVGVMRRRPSFVARPPNVGRGDDQSGIERSTNTSLISLTETCGSRRLRKMLMLLIGEDL